MLSGSPVVQCWVHLKSPLNFPPVKIKPRSPPADGIGLSPPWLSWEHGKGKGFQPRAPQARRSLWRQPGATCAHALAALRLPSRLAQTPALWHTPSAADVSHPNPHTRDSTVCIFLSAKSPCQDKFLWELQQQIHGWTRRVNPATRTLLYLGSCVSQKGRCQFQGNVTFLLIIFTFLHWFFQDGIYCSGIKWWNSPP